MEHKKTYGAVHGKEKESLVDRAFKQGPAKSKALAKAKGGDEKRKYIGLAGQRKMFDSAEHKRAVAKGKAESNEQHEFRD